MANKPWRSDKRRMMAAIERAIRMLRTTSSRYYAEWERLLWKARPMTDIREVIARAIYGCGWNIEKWPESEMQDAFLLRADAVLSAIEAAGMRIVPREPTEAKLDAGAEAYHAACAKVRDDVIKYGPRKGEHREPVPNDWLAHVYRAMLAATPQE